tara:strand:- start:2135 stop:2716 length:582 start_codon:yes stop_codon:yes gene_type:complete
MGLLEMMVLHSEVLTGYRDGYGPLNHQPENSRIGAYSNSVISNWETIMNKLITFLFVTALLALPAWVTAQTDQTYATYITEDQWQMINELPGVDRQIVSRDIGKLNLSVGIIHRGAVERASGTSTSNPERPCGVTITNRNSLARGIMHLHQTETYYIVSGSCPLVTGREIMNGNASAPEGNVTEILNGLPAAA